MIRTALGFTLACAIVGPITFMAADREPPFYRLAESEIVPHEVRSEEPFEVHWALYVNKHRQCIPIGPVHRWIIDSAGAVKTLEPVMAIADPQNNKTTLTRQMILPMGITSGPARYHAEACFACNPVQRFYPICITSPDVPFVVLPHL